MFSDPTRRVCSGCIKSFSEAGYEIKDNSTLDKAFEDREQVLRATNIHKLLPSVGEGASKSFQRDTIEGEQVNDISRDTNSAKKDNKGWKPLPLWQKILVIFAVLYVMGLIVQAFEKFAA